MDKFIIDNMGKKEILELFSPYASIPDTPASRYYDVIRSYDIKLELVEDIKYPQGRIRVHAKIQGDKWEEIGSVGSRIYPEIISKYRDMTINRIINV